MFDSHNLEDAATAAAGGGLAGAGDTARISLQDFVVHRGEYRAQ
jgi:hypothetical protein